MKKIKTAKDCRKTLFADAGTFTGAADVVFSENVQHRYYQHYTTLDCVLKMIRSRRWVLSRCNSLSINDLQEPKKFNDASDVLSRTYITCFGHGATENVAMWGLYGKHNPFAIRIRISGEMIRQWMGEIGFVQGRVGNSRAALQALDAKKISRGKPVAVEPVSATFHDMLYVAVENDFEENGKGSRRSHAVRWDDCMCRCEEEEDLADAVKMYAGWVKDIEWSYERESRLCVRFDKAMKGKQISLRIPDYVIDDMRFTLSPWLDKSLEGIVENAIAQALGSPLGKATGKIVRPSVLRGALNFK